MADMLPAVTLGLPVPGECTRSAHFDGKEVL